MDQLHRNKTWKMASKTASMEDKMKVGNLVRLSSDFRNQWDLCGTVLCAYRIKGFRLGIGVCLWNNGTETDES